MSTPRPSEHLADDQVENPATDLAEVTARTVAYYDQNAEAFVAGTVDVDMEELYAPFLELLPPGAHILDLGCGSGRDTLAFMKRGFRVTPVDASVEMAKACERLTGVKVKRCRFQELEDERLYDGIWACASLLHVPPEEMDEVIQRLDRASRPGTVWFLSFKLGQGVRVKGERLFVDHDELSLTTTLAQHRDSKHIVYWRTEDRRPERRELWLNTLLRKSGPLKAGPR